MSSIFAVTLSLFLSLSALSFPYDWSSDPSGTITRCYYTEHVKVHCEDFSEPESGKGQTDELQIEAAYGEQKYSYSYLRAFEGPLCREHLKKIMKLLRNSKNVCITGAMEMIDKNDGIIFSKWRGLETNKGKIVWW